MRTILKSISGGCLRINRNRAFRSILGFGDRRGRLRTSKGACVPARLAAAGWQTFGLHGNTGRFYARVLLYPALGFQGVRFHEQFDALERGSGLAPCPTASNIGGWCDGVVAAEAVRLLGGAGKRFVHMMSLDSHLPILGDVPGCVAGDQLCGHAGRVRASLVAIAAPLNAAMRAKALAPDLILLWGDHPPPFLNGETRAAFDPALVPVAIYRRQAEAGRS